MAMPRLAALLAAAHGRKSAHGADGRDDDDRHHITIRISRRMLRNVATTAAILLMGFLFSMSVNETTETGNQATLLPAQKTEQVAPQPVLIQKTEAPATPAPTVSPTLPETLEVTTASAAFPTLPETPKQEAEPQPQPEPAQVASHGQYCIVLASCISTKNAENYVADLHDRGYANARTLSNKKMNRVILDGYATEEEAYAQKSQLNRQGKEFAEAWVMKL